MTDNFNKHGGGGGESLIKRCWPLIAKKYIRRPTTSREREEERKYQNIRFFSFFNSKTPII